jgi:hypothetical protein
MIFALLTLLSALSLGFVSGWFSIIGIMTIYAGAAFHALIMGLVLEGGKLVTTSWLYRNWQFSTWKLKLPLIFLTIVLSLITSIGVFGFLSKAHLEQNASTIDNSAKIESLNEQIDREKSSIADNQKIINQLDATVNSYLGKDRTDKSVSIRKSQASQRKELRDNIDASQKRIDELSSDKFKLESELRKVQLEVGPIRYIAELIYSSDDANKNIESAVKIFTLIISLTLEPLAVILLLAANHTFLRLTNEKEVSQETKESEKTTDSQHVGSKKNRKIVFQTGNLRYDEDTETGPQEVIDEEETETLEEERSVLPRSEESEIVSKSSEISRQDSEFGETRQSEEENKIDSEFNQPETQEIRSKDLDYSNEPHFIPQKLKDGDLLVKNKESSPENKNQNTNSNKYPRPLSWLKEFVGK